MIPLFMFPICPCCGSACTWFDDFGSAAGGYTTLNASPASSNMPNLYIAGAKLNCTDSNTFYDDACYVQSVSRGALSGLRVTVEANCYELTRSYDGKLTSTVGVTLGNICAFYARPEFSSGGGSDYGRDGVNSYGQIDGSAPSGVLFDPGGSEAWADGKKLTIQADYSGTSLQYDVELKVDDVTVRTETLTVAADITEPFYAGLYCTDGAAWDNLCINVEHI